MADDHRKNSNKLTFFLNASHGHPVGTRGPDRAAWERFLRAVPARAGNFFKITGSDGPGSTFL
jgi:hypothetical protein